MSFRRATSLDAMAMGTFLVPVWLDAHRGQVPDEVWERRLAQWTPEVSGAAWRRTLDDVEATDGHPSTVLLAEDADGALAGIGMITVAGEQSATVDALYTDDVHRGSGLGRRFLQQLAEIAVADGVTSIEVDVLAANGAARTFYEHLGAELVAHGSVDDDGVALPSMTYRWSEASQLAEVGTS